MNRKELNELAKRIRESEVPTHFEPDESRLLIQVWRLVAQGQPVAEEKIEQIASKLKLSTEAALSCIFRLSERDEHGNIVGIFGLSQKNHPHKFIVDSKTFSTWCAWDALFLPSMLKQKAEIESTCPTTKETIFVTLTPERVERVEPDNAILSFILPQPTKDGLDGVEAVWRAFCCHVHFFSSAEAATDWFSGKEEEIALLTVKEGYQLGQLAFKEILQFV